MTIFPFCRQSSSGSSRWVLTCVECASPNNSNAMTVEIEYGYPFRWVILDFLLLLIDEIWWQVCNQRNSSGSIQRRLFIERQVRVLGLCCTFCDLIARKFQWACLSTMITSDSCSTHNKYLSCPGVFDALLIAICRTPNALMKKRCWSVTVVVSLATLPHLLLVRNWKTNQLKVLFHGWLLCLGT